MSRGFWILRITAYSKSRWCVRGAIKRWRLVVSLQCTRLDVIVTGAGCTPLSHDVTHFKKILDKKYFGARGAAAARLRRAARHASRGGRPGGLPLRGSRA